jgi:hypothetical protein
MPTKQPSHQTYLLRLWPACPSGAGRVVWRASLENPHTGQRLGFASLEALFVYLMEQTEATSILPAEEDNGPTEP